MYRLLEFVRCFCGLREVTDTTPPSRVAPIIFDCGWALFENRDARGEGHKYGVI